VGWKPSYIHLMISSLLKKEVIQIAGSKQTTKNYARMFVPAVTRKQLMAREVLGENPDKETVVSVVREICRMSDEETKKRIREAVTE